MLGVETVTFHFKCDTRSEAAFQYFQVGYFKEREEPLRALKNYWRAINVDTTFCDAYQSLTNLYLHIGELDSALFVVNKYLTINANDEWSITKKSKILMGLDRFDEARKFLEVCIKKHPDDGWYKLNIAKCYLNSQNFDSAFYFSSQAKNTFLNQGDNYSVSDVDFFSAKLLFYSKRYEESLSLLLTLDKEFRKVIDFNAIIGLCHYNLKKQDLEKAKKYIKKAYKQGGKFDNSLLDELNIKH